MADKLENNKLKNYKELSESQIFEKIKKDLNPIQESLTEKKITVDEAKSELKKINEWLQGTNIEKQDKQDIGKAFEKLINLERNIDENMLKKNVEGIINLLESLTKRDLAMLKKNIQKSEHLESDRPIEVQQGIKESSKNLDSTINDASEDSNPIANWIGKTMKRLNS